MIRCNGVFKGGGAKGVAYVGALEACEQQGVEFDAVAGSSAGAITAVLVAAGFDAAQLHELMPQALATIQRPLRATFVVGRSSLLSNERLRDWLDRVLVAQLARKKRTPADGARCTFDDLFAATEIGVFVVAMDLASRQPIVFSHELTPNLSVADAVVASSAIPVAFPPSLVEVDGEIHRLVDGGAYANYPSFVFDDPSFRAFHRLPDCEDVPTIGFVLDQDGDERRTETEPRSRQTFPMATDRGSVERELGMVGAAIGSPLARWSLVLLPILFALVTALWLIAEAEDSFPVIGSVPGRLDALEDVGLLLLLLIVATVAVIGTAAGLVLARFGRELLDGGVMGAVAAMGVGPNVPYWVGADRAGEGRHVAVRLTVPQELTTLAFGAPPELVETAITGARLTTSRRLSAALGAPSAPESEVAIPWQSPDPLGAVTFGEPTPQAGLIDGPAVRRRRWQGLLKRRRSRLESMWVTASLGLTSYIGFAAVGFAAYQGLADLIDGQVTRGIAWLSASGFGMVLGLIGLAARKHMVAKAPFPVLGRFNDGVLLVAASLGIAATVATVNHGLNTDRASMSTVSRTDSVPAEVEYIDTADDDIPLVWVEIGDDLRPLDIDRLTRDHRGTTVTACDDPAGQDDSEKRERIVDATHALPPDLRLDRCLVFDTDETMGINRGDPEIVRYDLESGLAFLEVQMWSIGYTGDPALYLIGIVAFMSLSYHSVRAMRWRRSRRRGSEPIARR